MGSSDRRIAAASKRLKRLSVPRQVEADFAEYRDDPARFAVEVLGVESATRRSDGTAYQFEVLADVVAYPRVTLRKGRGVGGTTIIAIATIHWTVTRPNARVVIIAPTHRQLLIIFAEIRRLERRARLKLPVTVLATRMVVDGHGEEWSAVGVPATTTERIEGYHAEGGLLLILDESKGIPQEVFDSMQGALTGGDDSRILVVSTPGGNSGPFYRVWAKDGDWKRHHVSSEDSSNVAPSWCQERAADWGRDSPLYMAHVQGEFPDGGAGVLFPLSLLEPATTRPATTPTEVRHALLGVTPEPEVVLGVDVARSLAGDWNCVAVARGDRLESLTLWRSADLMATVAKVGELAVLHRADRVRVDSGGVGAGACDRLRQLGFRVEEVAFGGGADEPTRFRNRRAEMFFALRERLEAGAALLDDDALLADLSAMRYVFDQSGRILLESKDDMRRRIGRSPDRADATALALGMPSRRPGVAGDGVFRILPFSASHFLGR